MSDGRLWAISAALDGCKGVSLLVSDGVVWGIGVLLDGCKG